MAHPGRSILVERWYPLAGGIICCAFLAYPLNNSKFASDSLMSSTASAASAIIGFLATALSIIFAISNTEVFATLVRIGYRKELFGYIRSAIYCNTFLLVVSTIYMIDFFKSIQFFSIAWAGLFVSSALYFIRVVNIFYTILYRISEDIPVVSRRNAPSSSA